jgi:SMI1 / KNR4 family (SUKH-1)
MNPMVLERLGGLHYSKHCDRSRPISRNDIARLESEIGIRLPEEYAEFLLSHPVGPVRFGKNGVFCRNKNGERLYPGSAHTNM